MSLTNKFIQDLINAISDYSKQFDKQHPMPPYRAHETQELLETLAKSTENHQIANPLKLKTDVFMLITNMQSNFFSKFWQRLNFSDLRYRLMIVLNNPDYIESKLLSDHLTELAKWAKDQNAIELRNQNIKLNNEIKSLQEHIQSLELENKALTEENAELQSTVEKLTAENQTLRDENNVISDKNRRLAERYTQSLGKLRRIQAENAAVENTIPKLNS
ncbi:MAG: hypothetical protein AB7F64_04130 [Gammaproteobacteria bacterium]